MRSERKAVLSLEKARVEVLKVFKEEKVISMAEASTIISERDISFVPGLGVLDVIGNLFEIGVIDLNEIGEVSYVGFLH